MYESLSPVEVGLALAEFIEGMGPGDALILWRDNNTTDWHVLKDGESYKLEKPR